MSYWPSRARIYKPFKEPRSRFPAWRNRFLGSLKFKKYRLCVQDWQRSSSSSSKLSKTSWMTILTHNINDWSNCDLTCERKHGQIKMRRVDQDARLIINKNFPKGQKRRTKITFFIARIYEIWKNKWTENFPVSWTILLLRKCLHDGKGNSECWKAPKFSKLHKRLQKSVPIRPMTFHKSLIRRSSGSRLTTLIVK